MVQQEEPRETERVDHPQLLLEPRGGVSTPRGALGVALAERRLADLRELARGALLSVPRVAVAEVAGELEGERLRQPNGLGDGIGVVREARRHRLGRGEHVAVVRAPHGLARIERGAVTDGDERILQERAHARVGMDVPGRHGGHAEAPGEPLERPVARPIAIRIGALELHPQALSAEGPEQRPRGLLVVDAVLRASGQADEALGVLEHLLEPHARLPGAPIARIPRVRVGERDEPAEVAPPAGVAHQQGEVPQRGGDLPAHPSLPACSPRAPRPGERDGQLGAEEGAHGRLAGGHGELHGTGEGVVVGQRERPVGELHGAPDELVRKRGPVKEGVGGVRVKLDVSRGATHPRSRPPQAACVNQRPEQRSWKTTRLRPLALTSSW